MAGSCCAPADGESQLSQAAFERALAFTAASFGIDMLVFAFTAW
jgi:hypothetical protein